MSNDDKVLSQSEIDALMNSNLDNDSSIPELTEEEIDVLEEIGNIAMGSAATALNTILNQKVDITTPKVSVAPFAEIKKEYSLPCVLVQVEYVAGLEGANLLIIKSKDAAIIADLMMGGDGINVENELNEIQLSAVGEAMNQMMGSSSTSMSSIISDVVNISPPVTRYLDLSDELDEDEKFFSDDQYLVDTSFQLKIADLVDSSFKQLAPLDFTRKLVKRLTSGGLTAKDEISESEINDSQVAATTEKEVQEKLNNEKTEREPQRNDQVDNSNPRPSYRPSNDISKEPVGVQRAQFPNFDESNQASLPQNMQLIQDVPLQVTVQLGKSRMTIKDILNLCEDSVVELDKLAGESVDLLVNGKLIAKGEVVVIDENFGFRVKDIISPMERINNI